MLPRALYSLFRMQISQMIQYVFNFVAIEECILVNIKNTWLNYVFSGEIKISKILNRT